MQTTYAGPKAELRRKLRQYFATAMGCLGMMVAGPRTLRPAMGMLGVLVLLMKLRGG